MISFIWSFLKRLIMAEAGEPDEATTLVGISLTGETGCCHDNTTDDTSLGFIMVDVSSITVKGIREAMQNELDALPSSFRFLTKQGWPVSSGQEDRIQVKHLINDKGVVRIQPDYAKPRIGVVTSHDNNALGFVFLSSLNLSISQLREAIVAQLGGSQNALCGDDSDWMFLDRNSWPICRQQEEAMAIIDIIIRACVRIHFCQKFHQNIDSPDVHVAEGKQKAFPFPDMEVTPGTPPAKKFRTPDENAILALMGHSPGPLMSNDTGYQVSQSYVRHSMRSLSPVPPTPKSGDAPISPKIIANPESAKQILISYVRAEASQYALDLKQELEAQNFSVYLDVHEIFCGSDWQDSLNFAVSHCSVFVPLVTPRYGETQWTNREVKLADVLSKFIVPVSFLEMWPPRCLAIQFATTQFIPWKLPGPGMKHTEAFFHPIIEKGVDVTEVTYTYMWERPDVAMVAKEIGKRCNAEAKKRERGDEDGNNKAPQLRSYASILPRGVGDLVIVQECREGKPLVVVSVHPKQREYASELVELFEDQGYEVWCSLDVLDDSAQTYQSNNSEDSSDTMPLEDSEVCDITNGDAMDPGPLQQFAAKADEAGVVVFVLSKAFAESYTCKEQVFYCETRKRVVPLVYEDFEMPGWMSMLIGTSLMEHKKREDYKDSLLNRVKRSLNASSSDIISDAAKETEISKSVDYVCNRLPGEKCVYISGGTKFFYDKSEEICKAIGISLARQERNDITMVTGGFYGVGETISRSFFEERKQRKLSTNVFHILPRKDEQDRSAQTRQNHDKTFQEVPFGKTIFCGDNVRQRETIVSRVFDICILVEGGPGAAHEAEEFCWSDHTVIPVKCTGGSAGGKFNVPKKIFEVPRGVSKEDWDMLGDSNLAASNIGDAVARIVKALQTGAAAQLTRMKSVTSKRASLVSQHSMIDTLT
ncbi:uncharacterized protein [Amphiura filiformis]|uniref:uncharacterized protein n=1 Tax=Amphiura filiformis TaxID=82378 RepID=UPI003B227A5E